METGSKQDRSQAEVETSTAPRESLSAPQKPEQAPECSQTPETAPEAATRAHSGTHEAVTPPPSPAAELRAAAAKLRNLIAAVPSEHWGGRPWHAEECSDTDDMSPCPCPCIVAQGAYREFDQPQNPPVQYVADAETPEHAAYIAAMHPTVGTAIVELLEVEAAVAEEIRRQSPDITDEQLAAWVHGPLAIARAINAANTPAAARPVAAENTQAVTR